MEALGTILLVMIVYFSDFSIAKSPKPKSHAVETYH